MSVDPTIHFELWLGLPEQPGSQSKGTGTARQLRPLFVLNEWQKTATGGNYFLSRWLINPGFTFDKEVNFGSPPEYFAKPTAMLYPASGYFYICQTQHNMNIDGSVNYVYAILLHRPIP